MQFFDVTHPKALGRYPLVGRTVFQSFCTFCDNGQSIVDSTNLKLNALKMNELETLFQQCMEKLLSKEELSASGSNRRYFRLESKKTSIIGVAGTSIDENRAFIQIAKHFYSKVCLFRNF